jgi:8-oxo-dGTP pyrophosphatase MutT (NUDIX family)
MTGSLLSFPTVIRKLAAWRPPTAGNEGALAAVAAILREGPTSAELLFIKRATREGDPWSGHIAFPGGKRDAQDPSLFATAVRETEEEVGLALSPASLLVRLGDFVARSYGYQVAEFVFALEDPGATITPNAEVAAVMWVPLAVLVAPESAGTTTFKIGERSLELPCIHIGEHVLWGMTHTMTQALLGAVQAYGP